jgi:two-component system, response regulator PdtaR
MDFRTTESLRLKIVVVEDDAPTRLFLKDVLENQFGHQVLGEAATGPDMVRVVEALEPDLVVFDLHLPQQDGLAALREIHRQRVVAAVAISGDRDPELVHRALDEHVLIYLVKPVEAHHLGPAVFIAWGQFRELQALTTENACLRQTLQNRQIVDRAKRLLKKRHRWSEAETFRRLQQSAMNRHTTIADLAQVILSGQDITS